MSATESAGAGVERSNIPRVDEWIAVLKQVADALPDAYMLAAGGAKDSVLRLTIVRKDEVEELAKRLGPNDTIQW